MENEFIMKFNENLLWASVIVLTIMGYFFNIKYLLVLIFWVIIIISIGNAKRCFVKEHFIFSTIVRRSIYVIPFFLPLLINFKLTIFVDDLIYWCLLGLIIGILLILPKINDWKIVLSKDIIEISTKNKKVDYYTQIMILIGAAVGEEVFFRNFVIGYIDNVSYVFAILLSCLLFFLNHFGVKWNNSFNLYDYGIQIIFSVISSIMFIASKSILPSIITHIIYNSPSILLVLKRYAFHYIYEKKVGGEISE